MSEIAQKDTNNRPVMLGIDPNGEIKQVKVVSGEVLGSGIPYPITGNEIAKRDSNGIECTMTLAGDFIVNLRLNDDGQIIF